MRNGANPEKFKDEKNYKFFHRIIIPVFIPNCHEEFYKESVSVFETCLDSLAASINFSTTCITIIDNGSYSEVKNLIGDYFTSGQIDKYVEYRENRGKVYSVLSEAKASFEPFVTIADADVFFFKGWEKAVFKVFEEFRSAGVVAPLPTPSLCFYKNNAVFFNNFLSRRIKYGKHVSEEDLNLYLRGLDNPYLLERKAKRSWKEKQYYLKGNTNPVLGSGHFVATYRREILDYSKDFPEHKFKKGYEENFLDSCAEEFGLYRLSTKRTFAYHMGNKLDEISLWKDRMNEEKIDSDFFRGVKPAPKFSAPMVLRKFFFKMYRTIKNL